MEFGSVHVQVRDGYVVAAQDDNGKRWTAATGRPVSRLLSHALVMGAVLAPFAVTAASAQPAITPGRASARMMVLDAELRSERELRRALPAAAPQADAPAAAAAAAAPTPTAPPPPARPYAETAPVQGGEGHFSFGWCTWYVSTKRYVPWMGNAIEWWPNARAMGFPEGQAPRVGAIMVTRESGYGHVAYVEAVDADGLGWSVSEMNFRGFGVTSTRHIRMGQVPLVGFIY